MQLFLIANKINYPKGIKISEIPEKISVLQNNFVLGGFVRYTSGHYQGYCRSPLERWHENDDFCKKPNNVNNNPIVPELIFYIKV